MFDRVIVTTNEDSNYYEFWPYVVMAWKKLFGVKVTLGVVTDKPESDPWIQSLKAHGDDLILLPTVGDIPTPSLALVGRHICAARYGDEVCMINDIDLLPLNTSWYLTKLQKRQPGQLLAIGANFFKGTSEEGKFPMGYATAEGRVWNEIINPNGLEYPDLIKSWIGVRVFDHKEDISNKTWHERKDSFSDESLIRVWIDRWNQPDQVLHVDWDHKPKVDSVDRSGWDINLERLYRGEYCETHMLRPFRRYKDKIKPLLDYLEQL